MNNKIVPVLTSSEVAMLNRLNQRYEQLANLSGDFSEAGVMSGKEPEEELYLNENLVTHRLKVFFGLDKSCSRNS